MSARPDRMAVDLAHLRGRPDVDQWRAAWRAKERWYGRWERGMQDALGAADSAVEQNLDSAVKLAMRRRGRVSKAGGTDPEHLRELVLEIVNRLVVAIRQGMDAGRAGALAAYLLLALDTGEDAGQFTLDALGLNRTFSWAGQRDFIRDQLAVRGSKIIQIAYGNHLERLAQMIVVATNPTAPKTVDEVRKEVLAAWPAITRADAQRIARTETGIVWERTNWYAMRSNGVERVRWLVAHGPAIGVTVGPVCPHCIHLAEGSPYTMDELDEIPPAHPNCRCTLVPVLDARWLPPQQPWTGSEAPLPTGGLDEPGGRMVPKEVTVFKAGRVWAATTSSANGWAVTTGRGWST